MGTTDQAVQQNLPQPEVTARKPRPRRSAWAVNTVAFGTIVAICYFAEETLVVILTSVLIAFIRGIAETDWGVAGRIDEGERCEESSS